MLARTLTHTSTDPPYKHTKHTHTHTHTHTRTYTTNMCKCMHARTHTHTHTSLSRKIYTYSRRCLMCINQKNNKYSFFSLKFLSENSWYFRVNVPNLTQVPNWHSLIKTSLELQLCPLFQINRQTKNPLGLWPSVKSITLKEETRLQLQGRFYQTAPICTCAKLGTFTLFQSHVNSLRSIGWYLFHVNSLRS
jgi:hypothetical protein